MTDSPPSASCPALLALELAAGSEPAQWHLERDAAAELAGLIAADLVRLLPGAEQLGLAVLGAVYDQAQVLRPGWPLYATLSEHYDRATRLHGEPAPVFALGTHAGRMPSPILESEPEWRGGTMLLLPWLLLGEAADVARIGARMEQDFVARGEAGAATSDWLMRRLGVRLQHARYLTRNDLCALASVQLEHAGFGALWQLLETALLAPERDETVVSASGQEFFLHHGEVRTAPRGYADWAHSAAAAYYREPQQFVQGFAAYLFELRQYAALLRAHALPLQLSRTAEEAASNRGYWIETVAAPAADTPREGSTHVFTHELRGLGVVVLTAARVSNDRATVLANAYPIEPRALAPALAELQQRYGDSGEPIRLGQLAIDPVQQALTLPASALANLPRPE